MANLDIDPKLIEKASKALLTASKVGRPWERLTLEQRRVYREETEAVIRAVFEELELKEDFLVGGAKGYPDPFSPTPNTLESASKFQSQNGGKIYRRIISDWKNIKS